jgi:tryptophan synthase alpha chain
MKKGRISKRFQELKAEGRKAFIPYIMAGAPSLKRTHELIGILEAGGADIIELGVPFTDPVADGPVIQRAAEQALARGVTLRKVLGLVKKARKKTQIPIVLMTYYNPVFRYGVEAFARDASEAGVDGLIVPDLPPHEAGELIRPARRHGLDTIFLFAPTSTDDRHRIVAKRSRGFIYYVSIAGITGSKLEVDRTTARSIKAMKALSDLPVAIGFGVSNPDEAAKVAALADGVIVGSAIVKRAGEPGLARFVASLRKGIDKAGKNRGAC